MAKAERIAENLPHFYRHWDKKSSISIIVGATGKRMDETEKELVSIMRSHWVDTATGNDLDRLGGLLSVARTAGEPDNDYRGRVKTAILGYKGGGTLSAIRMMVRIALRLPEDYPVEIVENPPTKVKRAYRVSSGKEWTVNPKSIEPAVADITLSVGTKDERISDPTIADLTKGRTLTYKGELKYGDKLEIKGGKALLNGKDVTSKMSGTLTPYIPLEVTKWKYTEAVGGNVGSFDSARFDTSVFAVDIVSDLVFEWTARAPATFELRLPGETLKKAGVTPQYLQGLLNTMKAGGVKAILKIT